MIRPAALRERPTAWPSRRSAGYSGKKAVSLWCRGIARYPRDATIRYQRPSQAVRSASGRSTSGPTQRPCGHRSAWTTIAVTITTTRDPSHQLAIAIHVRPRAEDRTASSARIRHDGAGAGAATDAAGAEGGWSSGRAATSFDTGISLLSATFPRRTLGSLDRRVAD